MNVIPDTLPDLLALQARRDAPALIERGGFGASAAPLRGALRQGAALDEPSAIQHVWRRLAKYKVPVPVLPIEEFPATPGANAPGSSRDGCASWRRPCYTSRFKGGEHDPAF